MSVNVGCNGVHPRGHFLSLGAIMLRRPHWSYSSLSQYLRCPLQFYFERIAKLPKPFISSNLVLGRAVHAALAEYHWALQRRVPVDEQQIQQVLLKNWQEQEDSTTIQFRDGENAAEAIDQGMSLLELYIQEPPPQHILGVEHQLAVPLYNNQGDLLPKPLVAVIDLLLAGPSGLEIVEFKTSSRRYGDNGTDRALQANCYQTAVEEYFGQTACCTYKVLVKTNTPSIQEVEADPLTKDPGRLGDLVQSVDQAVSLCVFYPVESGLNCATCPFYRPCREWRGASTPHQYSRQQELVAC